MLNQLIASMGPQVLSSLLNGAGGGALASVLGPVLSGGGAPAALTPAQASQLTPDQVQQIATHAQQHNPGIIDAMSDFYAQHAGLVKTLGGAALSIALAKMAQSHQS